MFRAILAQLILICCTASYADSVEQSALSRLKYYLRTMQSISVDFNQTDSNGTNAKGTLLIHKPYKFRCNYYQPFPILIIGNKNYVSVYDYDMETVSRINAIDNIFNFLLTEDISFEKYFQIISVIEQDNILTISLYHEASDRYSNISFNKDTDKLHTIEIFEDDNVINLRFESVSQVLNFTEDLFEFKNPDIFGAPKRISKDEIEKLIVFK